MSRAPQLNLPKLAGATAVVAGAATALLLALPATAGAATAPTTGGHVYVDGASRRGACSDSRDRATASVPSKPVCTMARGAALAAAPDLSRYALKRMATPLEVAQSLLFLTGRESAFITGQLYSVNGGQYM